MGKNNNCGCSRGGGTPHSPKTMANMADGARKKRGTGKKHGTKKAKRGGGIISTAAAPMALYGLARMAHRRHSKKNHKRRTHRRSMRGGSVLGNALPSLVLYGLARGMRGTKKNSNHNGNKTRKMRKHSRKGRRM